MHRDKAAVFILLGQSNAVGHKVPMKDVDIIDVPLKNVFGLNRSENQSFNISKLVWSGYTSDGMNLAEEQDHTYSIANCLATLWQKHIDEGNLLQIPDLYIIQIAIGGQGVTKEYMWHPEREKKLVPGKLDTVDISLFPFTTHIFSLLDKSFASLGKEYEIIGLHWRGGENDASAPENDFVLSLKSIYNTIFTEFNRLLHSPPIVLHRLACPDRMNDWDPTGRYLKKMELVNVVFDELKTQHENISIFDVRNAPFFIPNIRGNGLFIEDAVHFTPEVNQWVARQIFDTFNYTHVGDNNSFIME